MFGTRISYAYPVFSTYILNDEEIKEGTCTCPGDAKNDQCIEGNRISLSYIISNNGDIGHIVEAVWKMNENVKDLVEVKNVLLKIGSKAWSYTGELWASDAHYANWTIDPSFQDFKGMFKKLGLDVGVSLLSFDFFYNGLLSPINDAGMTLGLLSTGDKEIKGSNATDGTTPLMACMDTFFQREALTQISQNPPVAILPLTNIL
jgi:hypothetical protein